MRRFQVGDLVSFAAGIRWGAPSGPYEVVACLPRDDNASEYRYRKERRGANGACRGREPIDVL
jgi:hypothetical protein